MRRPGRVGRDGQPIEEPQSTEFSSYLYPHAKTPASQTLSVLSLEHEAMVLPSGEKATEVTGPLCALCFSAFSSRDAAASTEAVRFGLRVWVCQCQNDIVWAKGWRVSVHTHLHPRL